jgi:hypothetical protein
MPVLRVLDFTYFMQGYGLYKIVHGTLDRNTCDFCFGSYAYLDLYLSADTAMKLNQIFLFMLGYIFIFINLTT